MQYLGEGRCACLIRMEAVAIKQLGTRAFRLQFCCPVEELDVFRDGDVAQLCVDRFEVRRRAGKTCFVNGKKPKHEHARLQRSQQSSEMTRNIVNAHQRLTSATREEL